MKFVAVIGVLVVFCLLPIVDAASVSLSSSQLSLNGNAQIYFYGLEKKFGTVYLTVKLHYFRSGEFFHLKIESFTRFRSYAWCIVLTANFA